MEVEDKLRILGGDAAFAGVEDRPTCWLRQLGLWSDPAAQEAAATLATLWQRPGSPFHYAANMPPVL